MGHVPIRPIHFPPSPFVQLGIRENDPSGKQLLSDDEKRTEAGIRRMTAEERADRVKKEVTTWLTWLVLTWKPYTCPGILLCGARGMHPFPDDILQNYTELLSCRWERRFENIARRCPWYRACVSRCLFLHRRCHWLSRPVTSTFELRSLVT